MGILRAGDQDLHYSDNSHRWTAPPDIDQKVWEAIVSAHVEQHTAGEHGQARRSPRNATTPRTTGYELPRSTA